MYELIYTSVASNDFSKLEITELLEQARSKNERIEVTGMLIYKDREFVQLIEGEEVIIKQLYLSIEKDSRHSSIRTFYEGDIDKRAFSNWSMAFKPLDDSDFRILPNYESLDSNLSMRNLLLDSPNVGKELFLSLRNQL